MGHWHERTWDKLDWLACHTDRPRGRKYYINTLFWSLKIWAWQLIICNGVASRFQKKDNNVNRILKSFNGTWLGSLLSLTYTQERSDQEVAIFIIGSMMRLLHHLQNHHNKECSPAYHRLTTEVMIVQRKRNTVSVNKSIMIETRRAH